MLTLSPEILYITLSRSLLTLHCVSNIMCMWCLYEPKIKLMTSGDRGVCLHLEGQELGRRLLQIPAMAHYQMIGSHGRKFHLSFEDTTLKLSVSERSLLFTAKWTSSIFRDPVL